MSLDHVVPHRPSSVPLIERVFGCLKLLFAESDEVFMFPLGKSCNSLIEQVKFELLIRRFKGLPRPDDPHPLLILTGLLEVGGGPARILKNAAKCLRAVMGFLCCPAAEIDDVAGLVNTIHSDEANRLADFLRLWYVILDAVKESVEVLNEVRARSFHLVFDRCRFVMGLMR